MPTSAVTTSQTRTPESRIAQPSSTNGPVLDSSCQALVCRNGPVTMPHRPDTWRGRNPKRSRRWSSTALAIATPHSTAANTAMTTSAPPQLVGSNGGSSPDAERSLGIRGAGPSLGSVTAISLGVLRADHYLVVAGGPGRGRVAMPGILQHAVRVRGTHAKGVLPGRVHGPWEHPLPPGVGRRYGREPGPLPLAGVDLHLDLRDADVLVPGHARDGHGLPDRHLRAVTGRVDA